MLQRQNQPKKVEEEKRKKQNPWYVSTILQGNIDTVLCHLYWIYPTRLWDVKQTDIFSSLHFILISSEAVIFSLETGSVNTKKKIVLDFTVKSKQRKTKVSDAVICVQTLKHYLCGMKELQTPFLVFQPCVVWWHINHYALCESSGTSTNRTWRM